MKRFIAIMTLLTSLTSQAAILPKQGKVIIINGPSASGKSSIQKKIQEFADEPYVRLGVDQLFDNILPDYYGLGEIDPKGKFDPRTIRYVSTIEVDQKPAIKLHIGPNGRKVIKAMHYSIAEYAKHGNNVVVDYIQYEDGWFSELQQALNGIEVLYVGVKYPLEVIEQREHARSTSPVGHARSHYSSVHNGFTYDIEINNPNLTAEQIALSILQYKK